jgi:hypothetical protein
MSIAKIAVAVALIAAGAASVSWFLVPEEPAEPQEEPPISYDQWVQAQDVEVPAEPAFGL